MWTRIWLSDPKTKEEAKNRMLALKKEFERLKGRMDELPTKEELLQKRAEEREKRREARKGKKEGKKEGGF